MSSRLEAPPMLPIYDWTACPPWVQPAFCENQLPSLKLGEYEPRDLVMGPQGQEEPPSYTSISGDTANVEPLLNENCSTCAAGRDSGIDMSEPEKDGLLDHGRLDPHGVAMGDPGLESKTMSEAERQEIKEISGSIVERVDSQSFSLPGNVSFAAAATMGQSLVPYLVTPENMFCRTSLDSARSSRTLPSIGSLFGNTTRPPSVALSSKSSTTSVISSAMNSISTCLSQLTLEMPAPGLTAIDEELRFSKACSDSNLSTRRTSVLGITVKSARRLRYELRLAAMTGDLHKLGEVLETRKVQPDHCYNDGKTALSLATENGHTLIVKLLLSTAMVDVNRKDSQGKTPLALAAEHGHEDIAKALLAFNGVQLVCRDSQGQTPLHTSVRHRHTGITTLLLDTGKVDAWAGDVYGATPSTEAWVCDDRFEYDRLAAYKAKSQYLQM